MQFGYFDDSSKEYVITNPNTPKSWSNYLGSTRYGAIITNNAGGYSFYKSAASGRFMRMRFNSIPNDQPGRYLYLFDRDSKDFWSASWQPVNKSLESYKTTCRHGTAYTIIESEYNQLLTQTKYFVPLNRDFEFWHLKLSNKGDEKRNLRLFTFVEYANHWITDLDFHNLQYTQSILSMDVKNNIIDHGINVLLPDFHGKMDDHDGNRHTFLGALGKEVTGFDTDRDIFIGNNRAYSNPLCVEKGQCKNSIAVGDNGCGVLQFDIELNPGEDDELVIFMGVGKAEVEGQNVKKEFNDLSKVNTEFDELKKYWHEKLDGFNVKSPDTEFDSMINVWNAYNCLLTYSWSRAASLVYSGARDGLGYRDTVQDLLSVFQMIPDEAIKRLELMLTGQLSNGGALPVVKAFDHSPGNELPPDEENLRSDDSLWLFFTVPEYIKETGDIAFFSKVLPYADKGEDTVFNHLKKAIDFSLKREGIHNLPCGLFADWNDCLELGHEGETVFVAFQLRYALQSFIEISGLLNCEEEISWAEEHLEILDKNLQDHGWDGEWYRRAYRFDGLVIGSKDSEEGQIWLNPQTWAVISGHAKGEKARLISDKINERLASEHGLLILDPPYMKINHKVVKAPLFNPGMKENASIFNHTQGWAVMAEAILGNRERAYDYFKAFMPATFNQTAEIREVEPYVHCQYTHSKYSPRKGAGRLPWLTGAATWSYFAATHYILGIRPEYNGLTIDPCIPSKWKEVYIERKFRGKKMKLKIYNKGERVSKSVLILNGEELDDNFIPFNNLQINNEVEIHVG